MDILMVTPEMLPYAKTGGLADVLGALPQALAELGREVSVVLPCYKGIEEKYSPEPVGIELNIPILQDDQLVDKQGEILRTVLDDKVEVFFVKMDEYYNRDQLYGEAGKDYEDNCARFTFLCRAVLELVRQKGRPRVIHCHDWQAALVPVYLKTLFRDDPQLSGIPTVFTIHNLGYQGLFWQWDMKLIGVPWEHFNSEELEYYGKLNLLKGGIVFSDYLTTVSKGYSREIQTTEYGLGLDGVLSSRADRLFGITNGIDYRLWNPATDAALAKNFSPKDLSGKAACKKALQKEMGLPEDPDKPLVASISRLADQKGFDLIAASIDEIIGMGVQYVLLGTGDKKFHDIFEEVAHHNKECVAIRLGFDEGLAHRIEAGADLFLMPSIYEPCGLNQMISMKYGTVPLVRATGGLDDTVQNFDPAAGTGNGFKFEGRSRGAMLEKLEEALKIYGNNAAWEKLIANCMSEDHSWSAAARSYIDIYDSSAQ